MIAANLLKAGLMMAGAVGPAVAQASSMPITAPKQVTVDTETHVTLAENLFTSPVRIYLTLSPAQGNAHEGDWDNVCYLVNSTDGSNTDVKFTIPALVAPDGAKVRISVAPTVADPEPNPDNDPDKPISSKQYYFSGEAVLEGGKGIWSKPELGGFERIGTADQVPCTAYDCVRQCGVKYYLNDFDGENPYAVKSVYECNAACPGVTMKSWAEVTGQSTPDTQTSQQGSSTAMPTVPSTTSTVSLTASSTVSSSSTPSTSASSSSTFSISSEGSFVSTLRAAISFLGALLIL
ncbi:uncharacterized protein JN550_002053 [Neoarthrinium moseri]|uniref:uncharacterized protein n=1 Tax=Neoarthrinium moseri TaxID=1658444 RepID=UPI001FDAD37B|nr:uncharacterized protein JN550_002053 [Neoarthrinium moseri]KAI1875767.1 hypothetical protein JN550_002053 [Neoarthrinium moseri]